MQPTTTTFDLHLVHLWNFLVEQDYSERARWTILIHVNREGTTEGCPALEPEDRDRAEAILETAPDAVPRTSPEWDEWATEPTGAPTYRTRGDAYYADAAEYAHNCAMGTGPDHEPYRPSDADLVEYAEWSASLDGDGMDFPRTMSRQEKLEAAHEIVQYWIDHA